MKFSLVSGNGGTLRAAYYADTAEEAVAAANALETLGMRPNVVKSNKKYMIYVGLGDIKKNKQLREAAVRFLMDNEKRHAKGEGNCKKNYRKKPRFFQ